jgi:hypothetical protein
MARRIVPENVAGRLAPGGATQPRRQAAAGRAARCAASPAEQDAQRYLLGGEAADPPRRSGGQGLATPGSNISKH